MTLAGVPNRDEMTSAGAPNYDEMTLAGQSPPEDCERSRSENNEHDKSEDEHHGGPEDVLFRCFPTVNIEFVYRHCTLLLVGGFQPLFLVYLPRQESPLDRLPSSPNPVGQAIRPTHRRWSWLGPTVDRPLVTNCAVTPEHSGYCTTVEESNVVHFPGPSVTSALSGCYWIPRTGVSSLSFRPLHTISETITDVLSGRNLLLLGCAGEVEATEALSRRALSPALFQVDSGLGRDCYPLGRRSGPVLVVVGNERHGLSFLVVEDIDAVGVGCGRAVYCTHDLVCGGQSSA